MDPTTQSPQQQAAQARQQNLQLRAIVLANAVEMQQQIWSKSYDPTVQNQIIINPQNVGLIKGFLVHVNANIATTATAGGVNLTTFGASNILTNITFQDLSNNTRINTSGRHLSMLNSARMGFGYGGAYAANLPIGYGNNWVVQSAPATIAASTASTALSYYYYVPLAYSADDLTGSIYAAVTSGNMQLQLTINPTPTTAAGTDPLTSVYQGASLGTWVSGSSVTVTVYQIFLDQIPMQNVNGVMVPVLPPQDMQTIYMLNETSLTGLVTGQDFPLPYANYRNFLSTFATYDNGGTYGTTTPGITSWALRSANFTNLFKIDPNTAALFARYTFMADPPAGVYYFDHRRQPINTIQWGNMQLVITPTGAVNAGAQVLMATEAFANVNQIVGAASLAAG